MPSENLQTGFQTAFAVDENKTKPGKHCRHSRTGGNPDTTARKPIRRHSRESGNLEIQRGRSLSEMTETQRTGFPLSRE
ncbi:TPA: hypothetical protein WIV62_000954 [Neisseria meningitidis]|nr:hypothetical protein [Neisseria meningitidis]